MKQILVMGGGGFTRDTDLKLEKYLISMTSSANPKIGFLPQASNESRDYILKFYQSFLSIGAQPMWVSLFGRVDPTWKEKLLEQDIIYVGGGNTRSMLALWKEWGVDDCLQEAYDRGIILAGLSAGMICWFEQGITDSVWPLGVVNGLGMIAGSGCPHFDTELERAPFYKNAVAMGTVNPGYALDDGTGIHFLNGIYHKGVKVKADQKILYIDRHEEKEMPTMLLPF
jgi:dipeptidase E